MNKISVKNINSCEKVLSVEVEPNLIESEFNRFYQAIQGQAKVPGFRPGKAPRDVLVIHYKKEANERVLQNLISNSLNEAIRAKEIPVLGYPEIHAVQFDEKRLKYDAHIEHRPSTIKVGQYKGLKVQRQSTAVLSSDIDKVISQVQEAQSKLVPVSDRPAQIGDMIVCDYVCIVDGKEIEKRSEDMIALREKDYLEGFSKQLVGIAIGEEREVHVIFPDNYANKDFVGKKGVFRISVKDIKKRELPELNDELAQAAGEFKTLDELKSKIKEDLEHRKKHEADHALVDDLIGQVLKQSKLDLPKKVVERHLNMLIERQARRLGLDKLPKERLQDEVKKFRDQLKDQAEREVKLSFILEEIGKKEKVTVTDEDVQKKFGDIAHEMGRDTSEIAKYYNEHEDQKDVLRDQILNEKVVDQIKAWAHIENKQAKEDK